MSLALPRLDLARVQAPGHPSMCPVMSLAGLKMPEQRPCGASVHWPTPAPHAGRWMSRLACSHNHPHTQHTQRIHPHTRRTMISTTFAHPSAHPSHHYPHNQCTAIIRTSSAPTRSQLHSAPLPCHPRPSPITPDPPPSRLPCLVWQAGLIYPHPSPLTRPSPSPFIPHPHPPASLALYGRRGSSTRTCA
jgi:hypothetical protein